MKNLLILLISAYTFLFSGTLNMTVSDCIDNGDGTVTYPLKMQSDAPLYGFQFTIDPGTFLTAGAGASGGLATDVGWLVQIGANGTVLGFSMNGTSIAPQDEYSTLTELSFEGSCGGGLNLFDAEPGATIEGWGTQFTFGGHSFSSFECSNSMYTTLDDCSGAGFSWESTVLDYTWSNVLCPLGDMNQDDNLNVQDIIGMFNFILGNFTPLYSELLCGDINQDQFVNIFDILYSIDFIINEDFDCGECELISDNAGTLGLNSTSCYDNGNGTVTYPLEMQSDAPLYGFQFTIDPGTFLTAGAGASGGLAADAGWLVQIGANGTVLGFSMNGTSIAPQDEYSTLTELSFEGSCGGGLNLFDAEPGANIDVWGTDFTFGGHSFSSFECSNSMYIFRDSCKSAGFDWNAIYLNYQYNECEGIVDCNGECNGSAYLDECTGECIDEGELNTFEQCEAGDFYACMDAFWCTDYDEGLMAYYADLAAYTCGNSGDYTECASACWDSYSTENNLACIKGCSNLGITCLEACETGDGPSCSILCNDMGGYCTSYIFPQIDYQQIESGSSNSIPIVVDVLESDQIDGMVFMVEVTPNLNALALASDLSFISNAEIDVIVSQNSPTSISLIVSGFDEPLNNGQLMLGDLSFEISEEAINGHSYTLKIDNVSATDPNYELVEMLGATVLLDVITDPPEIFGLEDVYLLEDDTAELEFSVEDNSGTELSVEVITAPNYVSMEFDGESNTGVFYIDPSLECEDYDNGSGGLWYDIDGPVYDCVWYETYGCPDFGDIYANFGYNGLEACCACGGGTSGGFPNIIASSTLDVRKDGLQLTKDYSQINRTFRTETRNDLVRFSATNSEPIPEVAFGEFNVHVNHYPYINQTEDIYVLENSELSIEIESYDEDGHNTSIALLSAPDYVNYIPMSSSSGTLEINTYEDFESSEVIFEITDDGNPVAVTTNGFNIINNHAPEILGMGDFHLVENNPLDTLITFFDEDGDYLNYEVLESPEYLNIEPSPNGLLLQFDPSDEDVNTNYNTVPNNACELPDMHFYITQEGEVWYNFSLGIGGVQFDVLGGTMLESSGGILEDYGFLINNSATTFLSFNMSGDIIPPGCGTLVNLELDGIVTDADNFAFTFHDGNDFNWDLQPTYYQINPEVFSALCDYELYFDTEEECTANGGIYISLPVCLDAFTFSVVNDFNNINDCMCGDGGQWDIETEECINGTQEFNMWLDEIPIDNGQINSGVDILTIRIEDQAGLYVEQSVEIKVYDTFIAGDTRPYGQDINGDGDNFDAGEFGDENVLAPDVINALKIATEDPNIEIPLSSSNLFNAFDVSPIDIDINQDGDFYDMNERGGDGLIEANDVILSLKRATMVPGYENIRRVDNQLPYSTNQIISTSLASRDLVNDTLLIGEYIGLIGDEIEIPITLKRGQGSPVSGLIAGFNVNSVNLDLEQPIDFEPIIDGSIMSTNSGNQFISLLLNDINIAENSETIIGHLKITIPEDSNDGDEYSIIISSISATTNDFELIMIDEGNGGIVIVDANSVYGCTDSQAENYNPNANTDNSTCEFIPEYTEEFSYDSSESIDLPEVSLNEVDVNIVIPSGSLDISENTEVTIEVSEASEDELQNIIDNSLSSESNIQVYEGISFEAVDGNGNMIELNDGSTLDIELTFEPERNNYDLGYIYNDAIIALGADCIDNGDNTWTCIGDAPGFGSYIVYSFDEDIVFLGCMDSDASNYDEDANLEDGTCQYGYFLTHDLGFGNNLISFPGYLENDSSQDLLEGLISEGTGVVFLLGQGVGLFNTVNGWSGNLNNILPTSGYWINVQGSRDWNLEFNSPLENCTPHDISYGNNLLSYKWGNGNVATMEALGGEEFATENFNFILGQGVGLFNTVNGWSGNLNNLQEGKGYWVNITNSSIDFKWGFDNCANLGNSSLAMESTQESQIPEEFQFTQSTEQAFYLINDILVDNEYPRSEDFILAYHDNVLLGSAYYNRELTVLPVMGRDISDQTLGFIEVGQVPSLKLYKASTGEIIDLEADLDPFINLLVSEVQTVTGSTIVIPENYALHPAYPNPFNPVTNISYGLPMNTEVTLNIYDVEGRKISSLVQGIRQAGNHTIKWNAEGYPSGVYFVKLDADKFTQTQKLMLVK